MTKITRSATALALAALLTLSMSCGDTTSAPIETTTGTQTPAKTYPDDLPEDLNFGGKKVTFLYRAEISQEFYADSENGEVVNDAIYNSMRSVEDRLGVDINVVLRDGHYVSSRGEYINHIKSMITAGDPEYDWVDMMIGLATIEMSAGIFRNIADNS